MADEPHRNPVKILIHPAIPQICIFSYHLSHFLRWQLKVTEIYLPIYSDLAYSKPVLGIYDLFLT